MSDHFLIGAVLMAAAVVDLGVGTFVVAPRMPPERQRTVQGAFFGGALTLGGIGAAIMGGLIRI